MHRTEGGFSLLWPSQASSRRTILLSPLHLFLQIIKFQRELLTKFLSGRGGSFHMVSVESCFNETDWTYIHGTNPAYLSSPSPASYLECNVFSPSSAYFACKETTVCELPEVRGFRCQYLLAWSNLYFDSHLPYWHLSVNLFYIFQLTYIYIRSRDSAVGIATGYGLDDWEVGVRIFLFSKSSKPALGFTQPIQWVSGALSPGVKRQRREADHSPPSSAELKKIWIYTRTSTPPYAFMA
jgi:hypothetical protein